MVLFISVNEMFCVQISKGNIDPSKVAGSCFNNFGKVHAINHLIGRDPYLAFLLFLFVALRRV